MTKEEEWFQEEQEKYKEEEPERDESPTSTLSLPTKQVWKIKGSKSTTQPQEEQPESPPWYETDEQEVPLELPFSPNDAPWEEWIRQGVLFGGLKNPNPRRKVIW